MKKTVLSLVAVCFLGACATDPYTGESKVSKTAWGTGIGAAVGAGVGALIGGEKGALIGAGIGGAAGAATGGYMDVQASKLGEKLRGTGVQVLRDGDNIRLIMPNSITFNTNDDTMKTTANQVLDSVALVANEYDKTRLQIVGHTDSTGNDKINIPLSQRRATSVAQYLALRGVNPARMQALGVGASQPIASNAT
ncbi:MAG: OmpA family protein, partial [Alphaproteobacteria bacterium]|nr:OmpA family protein [Alphaproteobacteria bacterium]